MIASGRVRVDFAGEYNIRFLTIVIPTHAIARPATKLVMTRALKHVTTRAIKPAPINAGRIILFLVM